MFIFKFWGGDSFPPVPTPTHVPMFTPTERVANYSKFVHC